MRANTPIDREIIAHLENKIYVLEGNFRTLRFALAVRTVPLPDDNRNKSVCKCFLRLVSSRHITDLVLSADHNLDDVTLVK